MRVDYLRHEFVELIPAQLEDGVLYISIPYATASHQCCCGCGQKVVTPLTPTDWELSFNGATVSLWPSIGNWSFDCRSHYIVRRGQVHWMPRWSQDRIDAGRRRDRVNKEHYLNPDPAARSHDVAAIEPATQQSALRQVWNWTRRHMPRWIRSRLG